MTPVREKASGPHLAAPSSGRRATAGWQERVGASDWDQIRSGLDAVGCALTGPLLTPDEAA
jgi:hypothetical protein